MFSNFHSLTTTETMILSVVVLCFVISITTIAVFLHFYYRSKKVLNLTEKILSDNKIIPSADNSHDIKKTNIDLLIFKQQAIEEIDSVAMKVNCEMDSLQSILEKILPDIEKQSARDNIERLFMKQSNRFIKILDHSKSIITDPTYSAKRYYSFKKMKETHLPKNVMELLLTGTQYSLQELIDQLKESEDHIASCIDELMGLDIIHEVNESGMKEKYKITEKGVTYYLNNYD